MEMMIHLSREKFSKAQMVEMEKEVLRALEWKLHPPTASVFLSHFLLLLEADQEVKHDVVESARFYMELAVLDYSCVNQRPSRVALAALLNAMDQERSAALDSGACSFVQERQYNFLLSLIAPSERDIVDRCRSRLNELFNGLAADEMEVVHFLEDPVDGRMASPVSVATNNFYT
jgi:Cyclin, C-terminal domain